MGTGTKIAQRCYIFKLGIWDRFNKHSPRAWHLFTQLLEEDEANESQAWKNAAEI